MLRYQWWVSLPKMTYQCSCYCAGPARLGAGEGTLEVQVSWRRGLPKAWRTLGQGESPCQTSSMPRKTHRSARITQMRHQLQNRNWNCFKKERRKKKKEKQICGSINNYTQCINVLAWFVNFFSLEEETNCLWVLQLCWSYTFKQMSSLKIQIPEASSRENQCPF